MRIKKNTLYLTKKVMKKLLLLVVALVLLSCKKDSVAPVEQTKSGGNERTYLANIWQSQENNPEVVELINNIGVVHWVRQSQGVYVMNCENAFTDESKVHVIVGENILDTDVSYFVYSPNKIVFITKDKDATGFVYTDGRLVNTSVEVKVFY